jgi:hypothetical protein
MDSRVIEAVLRGVPPSLLLEAAPVIVYHGTRGRHLRSILSQGLIPDPKLRTWADDPHASFQKPSRASIGGIYVTANLMTATGAAMYGKEKGESKVIVVAQVQPQSLYADEDDITFYTDDIPLQGRVLTDYTAQYLYSTQQALQQNKIEQGWRRDEIEEELEKSKAAYVDLNTKAILHKIKSEYHHERMTARIRELLADGFERTLTRKAAHVAPESWKRNAYDNYDIPQPDKKEAETAYSRFMDAMTRTLRVLANPDARTSTLFLSARIDEPIRFHGPNRILAVLEIFRLDEAPAAVLGKLPLGHSKYSDVVIVRWPHDKKVPEKLIADWKQAVGEWKPID